VDFSPGIRFKGIPLEGLACLALLTGRSTAGVKHYGDKCFAVANLSGIDEAEDFGEWDEINLQALIGLWLGFAGCETFGEKDLHPFAEEAGAGVVAGELCPFFGTESGFFDELALGGGEALFVAIDFSGRNFIEVLGGGVAVLTLDDDERILLTLRVVDGEDDDGAVVPDDVALDGREAGLEDLVLVDAEERPLVGHFGRADGRGFAGFDLELSFYGYDRVGCLLFLLCHASPHGLVFPYVTIPEMAGDGMAARGWDVAVIGRGNWGSSLTAALGAAKIPLREVVVRGRRVAGTVRWKDVALEARVLWLCVPDGGIAEAAKEIVQRRSDLTGQVVVHSSGALTVDALAAARRAGAKVASVHPAMTFPTREVVGLAGVFFGIEAEEAGTRRGLHSLVRRMGGRPFNLRSEDKAMYHAAGTLASPLLVSVLTAAVATARLAGLDERTARLWVQSLAEPTFRNVFVRGAAGSFSGPFARGDADTIRLHLQSLHPHPILAALYRSLAEHAVETLPVRNRAALENVLKTGRKRRLPS